MPYMMERRIPLHDGILERTVDDIEEHRRIERDFWVRIANARRVRDGAQRRDGTTSRRAR